MMVTDLAGALVDNLAETLLFFEFFLAGQGSSQKPWHRKAAFREDIQKVEADGTNRGPRLITECFIVLDLTT